MMTSVPVPFSDGRVEVSQLEIQFETRCDRTCGRSRTLPGRILGYVHFPPSPLQGP